jgi:hypothetical protein
MAGYAKYNITVQMDRELAQLQRNIARIRRDIRLQSAEMQALIDADIDCTSAARLRLACREGANWDRVQAVMRAIDDYAEAATGNREYFWDRPVGIG